MHCGLSEGTCGVIKGILRSTGHTAISAYLRYKVNIRHPLQPTEDELPLIVSQAISIWVVRLSSGRDGRSNGKTPQNRIEQNRTV